MKASLAAAKHAELTAQIKQIDSARANLKEDMEIKMQKKQQELANKLLEVEKNRAWWKTAAIVTTGVGLVVVTAGAAALAMGAGAPVVVAGTAAAASEVGFVAGLVGSIEAGVAALAAELSVAAGSITAGQIASAAGPLLALL